MQLTAIHTVRLKVDGKRQIHPANGVFECSDEDGKYFLSVGAAREPTEQELALANMSKPKKQKAPTAGEAPGGDTLVG